MSDLENLRQERKLFRELLSSVASLLSAIFCLAMLVIAFVSYYKGDLPKATFDMTCAIFLWLIGKRGGTE